MKDYSLKFIAWEASGNDVIIYLRLILARSKSEFSTKIRGKREDWDPQQQRFTERTNYNKFLNNQLSSAEECMDSIYRDMLVKGIKPTTIKLRNEFRGEKDLRYQPMVLDYIENHISKIKLLPNEYKPDTIHHYNALHKRLGNFLSLSGDERILLKDFKRIHIVEFQEYLKTTNHPVLKKPMSIATSNKYISKLKVIVNDALHKEIILHNPFEGLKMKRVKVQRDCLTSDEIDLLKNADLGGNESLIRVRNVFLFSVYTGLRYSDVISLKKTDIVKESDGRYRMLITQRKTGERLYRPMLHQAVELYLHLKTKYPDSDEVLPKISNQKLNSYLKVIAGMIGFKKPLHHHLARHTFATTILLEAGVPIKLVSHFLGHKSLSTTSEIYAKVSKALENDMIDRLYKKSEINKSAIESVIKEIHLN
tara:strand:+ start:15430 stop:16695 length:1266 start_codon:yes stop_codon:yes gene_type:complete